MAELRAELGERPIGNWIIPGTHDSGTDSIDWVSELGPDAAALVRKLELLGPIGYAIIAAWAQTQGLSFLDHLAQGSRYFDLRIAPHGHGKLFFTHAMLG